MIKLICEVGYNHLGDIDKAIEIVDAFFDSCDIFKFQKMQPKTFLGKRYFAKNKNNIDYFGETYGEHREKIEFSIYEHLEIKDYIENKGKEYACSVHDIPSASEIIDIDPSYVKIASCNCNNFKLIDYCLENFPGFLHVSTGMTTKKERRAIVTYNNNIIPYSCTSCYDDNSNIFIERMPGFSCHSPNIFFAKAAISNGARFIEYHCTIDRDIPAGRDPKISLLPDQYLELREWIEKNQDIISRIDFTKPYKVPESEVKEREKAWSTA